MRFIPLLLAFLLTVEIYSQQTVNTSWTKTARLVGADIYFDMTSEEIHAAIDKHHDEGVSVMLFWARISDYLYEWTTEDSLYITDIVNYTHSNYPDMKAIMYVGPLEKQTTDVDMDKNGIIDPGKTSVYTEHPEWLQVGISGKPAVFYGAVAFWIDSTSEDVFLCPNDPVYRQIWIDNFAKIAETGLDGVWWDVPFFFHYFGDDWDGEWPCHCSDCQTEFQIYSGSSIPDTENWKNPVWRKFIDWRFETMGKFISECRNSARSVNPDFILFNEAWNPIEQFEPQVGFEASFSRTRNYNDGIAHEFHPLAPDNYHYFSWLYDAAIEKIYRGIDRERPSWILNYSQTVAHSKLRAATNLFTHCNFYEVNYPVMASTVSLEWRTEILNWIKEYEDFYFGGNITPYTNTAILYSPFALSYYGNNPEAFAEELKGIVMMLFESHIPFEIIPVDLLDEVSKYDVLILPNVTALSDSDLDKIRAYVNGGGKIISTGFTSYLNEDGSERGGYGLLDVFGAEPDYGVYYLNHFGDGISISTMNILGNEFYIAANPHVEEAYTNPVNAETNRQMFLTEMWNKLNIENLISTDAPKEVIFNLFRKGDTILVAVNNYSGLTQSDFSTQPQNNISLSVQIPAGMKIKSAVQIDYLESESELEFNEIDGNKITCTFDLNVHKVLCFSATEITSVEDYEGTKNVVFVGPNPAKGLLKITLPASEKFTWEIYNSIGQLIKKSSRPQDAINIANYANGIYFIKIDTKTKTYLKKFVVLN